MSSDSGGDDGSKMQDDKGGVIALKKGPWTQAEDAILKEYFEKHGEGNWNAVQKNSGLARCVKSCRLRWVNHLRPDLKKGAFTKKEEQQIVELHAIMGNKWSQIAAKLPGRTDNEIKNFWKTRIKKMQRAGLTTYLDETEIYRQQVSNGDQENLNPNVALTNEVGQHNNVSQTPDVEFRRLTYLDETEIYRQQVSNGDQENLNPNIALTNEAGKHENVSQTPDVEFRRLTVPPSLYDPSLYMPMPPVSGMLPQFEQCTYSSQYNVLPMPMPMMHPSKRLRGSDMIYNSLDPSAVPGFDQYGTSVPYKLTGSHADLNGNISVSSDPIYGDFKVELPSLQYFEARKRIWSTSESSLPPLVEAADTPESSIQFQPSQTGTVSHQNNDSLLESVIYGSNNLNGSNNVDSFQDNNVDSFQENNDHCAFNEVVQNSTWNPSETQWEQEELRSSLGPYAASVGDKHGTLTEFPADSPSPESQNLLEFLLDPDPAPDLSFLDKNSGA